MTASDSPTPHGAGSLKWWLALAGIGLAAFVALDLSRGSELAPDSRSIRAGIYLGAAAVLWHVPRDHRYETRADDPRRHVGVPWYRGCVRCLWPVARAGAPVPGPALQTIAMAGFGIAAAVALLLGGNVGAGLVAAGLLVRSMAEVCCVLDTLLALGMVIAILRS